MYLIFVVNINVFFSLRYAPVFRVSLSSRLQACPFCCLSLFLFFFWPAARGMFCSKFTLNKQLNWTPNSRAALWPIHSWLSGCLLIVCYASLHRIIFHLYPFVYVFLGAAHKAYTFLCCLSFHFVLYYFFFRYTPTCFRLACVSACVGGCVCSFLLLINLLRLLSWCGLLSGVIFCCN